MDKHSILYCAAALAVSLLISWLAFPYAALDRDVVVRAETPQDAEVMGSVNVGNGFGMVPVVELMSYYIENPPLAATGQGAVVAPKIKFGGC